MGNLEQQHTWASGPKEEFANKNIRGIEGRLYELCNPVVIENGLELYDLQYNVSQSNLVLFIQNPVTATVLIEDCIKIDRALGPLIEAAEWIPNNFVLEVSSPGVNRLLRFQEHFVKAINSHILLQLHHKLNQEDCPSLPKKYWNLKKIRGVLLSVEADKITLSLDSDFSVEINCKNIKKANLDPDLWGKENTKKQTAKNNK
jgi:ribosome maturation factor RimP